MCGLSDCKTRRVRSSTRLPAPSFLLQRLGGAPAWLWGQVQEGGRQLGVRRVLRAEQGRRPAVRGLSEQQARSQTRAKSHIWFLDVLRFQRRRV